MKKDIKGKWVAALRSGEYSQGAGVLRHKRGEGEDGFCCLGVLCDVVDPGRWDDNGTNTFGRAGSTRVGYPEKELLQECNLSVSSCTTLAELNDKYRLSFEEIADWIEENL